MSSGRYGFVFHDALIKSRYLVARNNVVGFTDKDKMHSGGVQHLACLPINIGRGAQHAYGVRSDLSLALASHWGLPQRQSLS